VLADGIERAKNAMADVSKKTSDDIGKGIESLVGPEGSLAKSINEHLAEFSEELGKVTGDEHSPIRAGIQKQLDAVSKKLTDDFARVSALQKDEFAKILDPNNATSPMRLLSEDLRRIDKVLNQVNEKVNQDVVVAEIMSEVPQGGNDYEADAVLAIQRVAGWAGDDCMAVGNVTGRVPRSKKGDALIDLRIGATIAARIVVECKDSDLTKPEWLTEAAGSKANRAASGFIGLCKSVDDMPNKSRMMVIDAQSIVLAYDPAVDDAQILHLIYQVVKFNTMRATGNLDEVDMAEVNKRLEESIDALKRFDEMSKQLKAIENSVVAVRKIANDVRDTITDNVSAIRKSIARGVEKPELSEAETLLLEGGLADGSDADDLESDNEID
jgi:hypothetical protein